MSATQRRRPWRAQLLVGWVLTAALWLSAGGCGEGGGLPKRGRSDCAPRQILEGESEVILFGDLHAHSTESLDAYVVNLPLVAGGDGPAPPSERCRYARYCSRLDFWAIADHPEEQTSDQWASTVDEIRACNDQYGGYDREPELVSFLGWEWTQKGPTPETDQGHRNVVLRDTCADKIPPRPFTAPTGFGGIPISAIRIFADAAASLDPDNEALYSEFIEHVEALSEVPPCDPLVPSTDLPEGCLEVAQDPADLFARLDAWGLEALVIPHGRTWGSNHPPLSSWEGQIGGGTRPNPHQGLVEIYSGHGNGEPYRPWRHVAEGDDGPRCPEPNESFEPCCHRAGEIIRARSTACAEAPEGAECLAAVEGARQAYVDAGQDGPATVSGVTAEDWLDCGQCRDCELPAATHRPLASVQAALATTAFGSDGSPERLVLGFVGSTDSHNTGPGAGYRESLEMSDVVAPASEEIAELVSLAGEQLYHEFERMNAFYYGGGLVAVHSRGRSRDAIWQALAERRVYATSGERIQLWFHLENGPEGNPVPMGARVSMADDPRFEVHAMGSFRQAPGCPEEMVREAPEGFVDRVCLGECYHPTAERHLISRIEVVRITPQIEADEPLDELIVDPFLTLSCDPDPEGCTASFSDPDFVAAGRPTLYYVRAYQEPTPMLNADALRCERDADGACTAVSPCRGRVHAPEDDCLSEGEELAWASPIYLDPAR